MTLSHSNADAERVFSMFTEVVINLRTHLVHGYFDAICVVKSEVLANGIIYTNIDVNHLFLKRSDNLYARVCNSSKKLKVSETKDESAADELE